jgi:hypothetical protein
MCRNGPAVCVCVYVCVYVCMRVCVMLRARQDTCALPADPVAFFRSVVDGATHLLTHSLTHSHVLLITHSRHIYSCNHSLNCSLPTYFFTHSLTHYPGACIYMTAICYYTIMELNLLRHIPTRFSLVTHYSDRAVPDMDPLQKGYGVVQTSHTLQKLYDTGHLLSVHAMNMHYTHWRSLTRPVWLHCVPIGMNLRFYLPYEVIMSFLDAIHRNVVTPPLSHTHTRPLLLAPFTAKRYARDRARALRELGVNIKKGLLRMTQRTFDNHTGK